jgi:peroxiredoxin
MLSQRSTSQGCIAHALDRNLAGFRDRFLHINAPKVEAHESIVRDCHPRFAVKLRVVNTRDGTQIIVTVLVLLQTSCGSSNDPIPVRHPLTDRYTPDFVATDAVTGAAISTRAEPGMVRIYFFGATWCGSCDRAWEQLDVLRDEYHSRGLFVVGVAEASEQVEIKRDCKRLETKIPIVNDKSMSIAGDWLVSVLPSLFVVDRANVVRFVHTGYRDGDMVEVEREVEKLLANH